MFIICLIVSHIWSQTNQTIMGWGSSKILLQWYHVIVYTNNCGLSNNPQMLMQAAQQLVSESLQWRHNDHDSVSNHQPHGCLLNRLFRRRSKKTSKLRVTGLCVGNSPGPMNSPHKVPVTRKMFPFDDVIMIHASFCTCQWSEWTVTETNNKANIVMLVSGKSLYSNILEICGHRGIDCSVTPLSMYIS